MTRYVTLIRRKDKQPSSFIIRYTSIYEAQLKRIWIKIWSKDLSYGLFWDQIAFSLVLVFL